MMGGYDMMGWGAGSILGPIVMILFWVLIVAGTVWLVLTVSGQTARRQDGERGGALRILEERLARGEIDVDDYKARKAAIGGT